MQKFLTLVSLTFFITHILAQPIPVGTLRLTRQTPVHDPVMIKQNNTWYLFHTGMGINVWSSKDLNNWRKERPVFDKTPEWTFKAIPGFRGTIWAPDISFHNGKYFLYYAVSAFGKNTSCIGVAVNTTLDSSTPGYKWIDMGKLIQSVPGRDMWNAIDPNLIIDHNNIPWLTFGSFWEGMKLVKLNDDLVSVAEPQVWFTVARRAREFSTPDTSAGGAAIEAPFIFKKGTYYYLFVSHDYCCRAEKSNYKVVVGRSENVTGPYIDKEGIALLIGGGTKVVEGNKDWFGAGHNAVYTVEGIDYNIFHGYDAKDKGRSKLIIQQMQWDKDGWPILQEVK
ncbi:MAG: arabinan endo-1,5-alpha-L-arabinosidase [Chitinophagaceae bacterium]